jgi:hypothetical protein
MSQKDKVLAHLKNIGNLTQLEATMEYRILRLGAIINVLRKEGYEIKTNTPEDKGNYAIYELLGTKTEQEKRGLNPLKDVREKEQESLFELEPEFKNAYDV